MEALFLLLIFVLAFLYASVGHGGASGYLALMALFGIEAVYMRSSALVLNLFVAGMAFYNFYRGGHFRIKTLLPFIIGSMPMAYIGASLPVNRTFFEVSLAICLFLAVMRMLFIIKDKESNLIKTPHFVIALMTGAVVGFFSGMVGIGGGIILSPLLILAGWASVKQSAAISAAFIWLNSFSGLLGNLSAGITIPNQAWVWLIIALAGGTIGSYAGTYKFSVAGLRYILATVLLMASFKLFF